MTVLPCHPLLLKRLVPRGLNFGTTVLLVTNQSQELSPTPPSPAPPHPPPPPAPESVLPQISPVQACLPFPPPAAWCLCPTSPLVQGTGPQGRPAHGALLPKGFPLGPADSGFSFPAIPAPRLSTPGGVFALPTGTSLPLSSSFGAPNSSLNVQQAHDLWSPLATSLTDVWSCEHSSVPVADKQPIILYCHRQVPLVPRTHNPVRSLGLR